MRTRRDDEGLTPPPDGASDAAERRCILSGAHAPRDRLIRLVRSPDGEAVADLAARLPGRGAWIAPQRRALEGEPGRRALSRALARAWKSEPPRVPADFVDRLAAALERRFLDRLGLERRLGVLQFGSDRLLAEARAGRLALLVHAADAAHHGVARLDQAMRVGGRGAVWRLPLGRDALSLAVGRANMVHLGIGSAGAGPETVRRLEREAFRWLSFTGSADVASGGLAADGGTVPGPPGMPQQNTAAAGDACTADEGCR